MDIENGVKLRVLLVDDEKDILDLYCNILGPGDENLINRRSSSEEVGKGSFNIRELLPDFECFEIDRCTQATEAISAVKNSLSDQRPYAMIFLDIRMPPGPDGLETAIELRRLDPYLNIIIITGYPEMPPLDIARLIPPLGRLIFLQKPVLPLELIQIASVMADKWRAEQALCNLTA
jgi:two-component system cell cycle sensor histidine kinase/response regulator CckA